jgi:hypothetical protein
LGCQIGDNCKYFSYDRHVASCVLYKAQERNCSTLIAPKSPPIDTCRSKLHSFSNKTSMHRSMNLPKLQQKYLNQRPNIRKVQKVGNM